MDRVTAARGYRAACGSHGAGYERDDNDTGAAVAACKYSGRIKSASATTTTAVNSPRAAVIGHCTSAAAASAASAASAARLTAAAAAASICYAAACN